MIENYIPVLVFMIVGIGVGLMPITISRLLGPKNPQAEKNSPYECGFAPFSDARLKFDVRYYLIAILFIIFDLEIAFLFPWAVVLDKIGSAGFIGMGIFLLLLALGFIIEWKSGALEWE